MHDLGRGNAEKRIEKQSSCFETCFLNPFLAKEKKEGNFFLVAKSRKTLSTKVIQKLNLQPIVHQS